MRRMSHYDVVPAPNSTFDRWTHPAFSGYNDGTYIWGRGAADDKSLLVAQCMSRHVSADIQGKQSPIYSRKASSRAVP